MRGESILGRPHEESYWCGKLRTCNHVCRSILITRYVLSLCRTLLTSAASFSSNPFRGTNY